MLSARTLTMAKRTDFVDRPAPVDGLNTKGCDPETIIMLPKTCTMPLLSTAARQTFDL